MTDQEKTVVFMKLMKWCAIVFFAASLIVGFLAVFFMLTLKK